MEQMHDPKYKVGDELTVEFIGRVIEVKIDRNYLTGHEKLFYTLEGSNGVRVYNVNENILYPLPTEQEVAQGK